QTSSFSSLQPAPAVLSPLSLHDALPISLLGRAYAERASNDYKLADLAAARRHIARALQLLEGVDDPDLLLVTQQQDAIYADDARSEEHTSELQSRENLVCRLLLEKKNIR